ncbi:rhomboid family intramembrane serine protease [Pelagicoccus sp. SDUM812005]|uniref:rhomboid family intramembrane serine protease n=1 Tax=Pelagicoccus sp. SDUM812005 TaxID=3041257 RepID=UPI00280DF1E9|nr:rhomboid family intramembrane serine protease [Pelagicoccus sp. SDUM812005]MDQ8182163.1 rhomboid family intramembrane serine protease [Pelagicoccus sp. SDUM812005]
MEEKVEEEALAVIGSYGTARQAHDAGLAVLACGHPYWVRFVEGRFLLVVMGADARKLKGEVDLTASRNRFWPPRSLDLSAPSTSKLPTAAAIGLLIAVFACQNEFPKIVPLAVNSSAGLLQGEWWRTVTAVTMHADLGHLAGNMLGLSIFAYLACRYMGGGLAWTLVLLSASLANLSNAWLRAGDAFSSLGASTAVFAALGLLAGYPVGAYLRSKVGIQTRDWLVPFFGGCVAFAWMGGGEFPTDVAGHFWAFGYGCILSVGTAWLGLAAKLRSWHQRLLLALTVAGLAASWCLALGVF